MYNGDYTKSSTATPVIILLFPMNTSFVLTKMQLGLDLTYRSNVLTFTLQLPSVSTLPQTCLDVLGGMEK